ncbi:hypothetical protein BTUL_0156g00260 [Botrytis tulipae]|uniref:Uncharacterized protein n=1 Tax=Botrytis tulipae TaxID=87230 RepID=A0A4Z1EE06_9HELO|nr:hypothetical protein BTUL_0156g00260 [Botrytis tulipae]
MSLPSVSLSQSPAQSSKLSPHLLSFSAINYIWSSYIGHSGPCFKLPVLLPFLVSDWLSCGGIWEGSRFQSTAGRPPSITRLGQVSHHVWRTKLATLTDWYPRSSVAIGTPVLIRFWLGVALEYLYKGWLSEEALRSFETFVDGLMDSPRQSEPNAEAENQASTSSVPTAELLGFAPDNRSIIAFNRLPGASPHPMARHLSTTDDGRSIYIYSAIPTDPMDADINNKYARPGLSWLLGRWNNQAEHLVP